MKSLLILPKIRVENANALSGILYGFPAITQFLGYVHALSRSLISLQDDLELKLKGCGIICHNHQVHTHRSGNRDSIFSLTRNPLTKDEKTPPFNEEGRVNIEISLVVSCDFSDIDIDMGTDDRDLDIAIFCKYIEEIAMQKPLAGGNIISMEPVKFINIPQVDEEANSKLRRELLKLLPGYVLLSRHDIMEAQDSNQSKLDTILNFCTLRKKASPPDEHSKDKVDWKIEPKSHPGWIVPIQAGYKAVSPLFNNDEVARTRDSETQFRFVEPIYSLAEWKGLHRIFNLKKILWRYHANENTYTCINQPN